MSPYRGENQLKNTMIFPSDIEVVFENEDVVVVNKPSGLVVHSDGKTHEPTLVDWLFEKYSEIKNIGESWAMPGGGMIHRPGVVHRLDRETSGVLLIAKTQETFESLKKQFQKREVEKIYGAFVYDELGDDKGVIDRPIGKSKKDFRLWSAQRGARGELRDAVTEWKVLGRGEGATFVEVRPKTGRTHQIRVHFKAIHHPVVCDRLYAPKRKCLFGFERLALHAKSITFKLSGHVVTVEAQYPEDFEKALKTLV